MENQETARHDGLSAAADALAEARRRAEVAVGVVNGVAGLLASGLRERGFSDRTIATALQIPRNSVSRLIREVPWLKFTAELSETDRWAADWLDGICRQALTQACGNWVQAPHLRSTDVVRANGIDVPPPLRASSLDTAGAQFDNAETGERILIYSLQRWKGQPLGEARSRHTGWDHRGRYRLDICSASGHRQPLPPPFIGLTDDETYFGTGWSEPARRRSDADAFGCIVAAVRRHYGSWPNITAASR